MTTATQSTPFSPEMLRSIENPALTRVTTIGWAYGQMGQSVRLLDMALAERLEHANVAARKLGQVTFDTDWTPFHKSLGVINKADEIIGINPYDIAPNTQSIDFNIPTLAPGEAANKPSKLVTILDEPVTVNPNLDPIQAELNTMIDDARSAVDAARLL